MQLGFVNSPRNEQRTLAELMSRVSMRDHAAFKQLYDATVCCLLGITVRMLHDRCWAEEVVQEVYVSIWHTAPHYSPHKAQPMTWLMAVARNKALDALRSSRADRKHCVRPTGSDDDDDTDLPDRADDRIGPLEQLLQAVDAHQLRCCLERLEPPQRQAIALAFYDGLTHAELALHMNQPLGTVKAWVRRGLDRMKRCLEPHHELPTARVA
jgi:RNA polymerase sigma factor (sigma-70 family)